VGLWQKFDKNRTVIDSIAIKQQKYRKENITNRVGNWQEWTGEGSGADASAE
jgi:hypothetical protein